MPAGTTAEETITKVLQKKPEGCTNDERETFLIFLDIGGAALNKDLCVPNAAREAFLNLTPSDVAWAITNFRHYTADDTELSPNKAIGPTPQGNASERKHKRRKIAPTKASRRDIVADYYKTKSTLLNWSKAAEKEGRSEQE